MSPLILCRVCFTAPIVEGTGKSGSLYVAEPLDACSSLTNKIDTKKNGTVSSPFVLIIRGVCSFEEKVRRAQAAGFKAAIIYDNEDGGLIASKDLIWICLYFLWDS